MKKVCDNCKERKEVYKLMNEIGEKKFLCSDCSCNYFAPLMRAIKHDLLRSGRVTEFEIEPIGEGVENDKVS